MGEAGDFVIELDELDDVVGDLEARERDLNLLVADLERQMAALHATWTGLAAAAQREAHQEWSQGMAAMHTALSELRAAARLAHGHYVEAATTNVDMWRQVT
jgi:WXG100 family type VII secretion target